MARAGVALLEAAVELLAVVVEEVVVDVVAAWVFDPEPPQPEMVSVSVSNPSVKVVDPRPSRIVTLPVV